MYQSKQKAEDSLTLEHDWVRPFYLWAAASVRFTVWFYSCQFPLLTRYYGSSRQELHLQ